MAESSVIRAFGKEQYKVNPERSSKADVPLRKVISLVQLSLLTEKEFRILA